MDRAQTSAAPELHGILERRRLKAEGKVDARNEGLSPPSRHPRDPPLGTSSAPVRLPVSRQVAPANGTGQSGLHHSKSSPRPFAAGYRNGTKPFDERKGHLETAEERISSMAEQNYRFSAEVTEFRQRLLEVAPTLPERERAGLIQQAEGLLREATSMLSAGQQIQEGRDRARKAAEAEAMQAKQPESQGDANSSQLASENLRLQEEVAKLRQENSELRQAQAGTDELRQKLREVQVERDRLWETAQASPTSSGGGGSEGRLRSVMTSQSATISELKSAIASVEAVIEEARREMDRKQLRERRAAYEHLHTAMDKADEEQLEHAIEAAVSADVDDEDILKAQNKLLELQMMTPEEKAAKAERVKHQQQKKDAFQFVKKNDVEGLAALLDSLEEDVHWQDWRDYAGRTLVRCAADLRSELVQKELAERTKKPALLPAAQPFARQVTPQDSPPKPMAMSSGALTVSGRPSLGSESRSAAGEGARSPPAVFVKAADFVVDDEEDDQKPELSDDEVEKMKAQALRAVVQDDCPALAEVLVSVHRTVWSRWENKAGKDLLTLSQERGSSSVYSLLAKSLGMVKEVKREPFEERQTVWVFVNGDVQPRRATVLEDTPEEADEVLLEFWDGDDPPEKVERCLVRAMWS